MKLQNRVLNFGLFKKLPLSLSLSFHSLSLSWRRTPPVAKTAPVSAMWTCRAHGLPPSHPLWLHGREARVPDPLEGRHDLLRHATPSPRSDLDQAGSTSPRSSKPSPLSVLPYKLEPQASTRAPRPLPASRARPTVEPPPPPPYSPIQAAHGLLHPIWQLPDPSPSALPR